MAIQLLLENSARKKILLMAIMATESDQCFLLLKTVVGFPIFRGNFFQIPPGFFFEFLASKQAASKQASKPASRKQAASKQASQQAGSRRPASEQASKPKSQQAS